MYLRDGKANDGFSICSRMLPFWREIYPSSAILIAGSNISLSSRVPLPNFSTVSTHAAAAPAQRHFVNIRKRFPFDRLTGYGDRVKVRAGNIEPIDPPLSNVV